MGVREKPVVSIERATRIYNRSFAYILWVLLWCFCGTPYSGSRCIHERYERIPTAGTLSFLLGCNVQPRYKDFCYVLLYLFCCVWLLFIKVMFFSAGKFMESRSMKAGNEIRKTGGRGNWSGCIA